MTQDVNLSLELNNLQLYLLDMVLEIN